MKKILQGERSHYLEMKKAYNAKEMEIRRLKRENFNIKSEIQSCSNLLKRGEQMSSTHTKIYVSQLENDKCNLETQLKSMEEKLIDISKMQRMHWVETFLTSASKDSRDLKDKLYILLREKTSLADNYSKTQKELAKSRLDSIKLKVLLGRIVDEFKIKIDERNFADIGIDEGVFENLKSEQYQDIDMEDSINEIKHEESVNEMLNESTIVLLGGRDKLGNALPQVKQIDLIKQEKVEVKEISGNEIIVNKVPLNDELPVNVKNIEVDKENSSFQLPLSSSSPIVTKDTKNILPLKDKVVKFSTNVETKIIDSTKEEFKQSQEARKRPAFTVKHIKILPRKPQT